MFYLAHSFKKVSQDFKIGSSDNIEATVAQGSSQVELGRDFLLLPGQQAPVHHSLHRSLSLPEHCSSVSLDCHQIAVVLIVNILSMHLRVALAAVTNQPPMGVTSCNKLLFYGLVTVGGDGFPPDGE